VRELDELLLPFRVRAVELLARMRADGFDPLVWETWRSVERAAELERKKRGKRLSMHCIGCALDIVERSKRWDAPPAFWRALDRHARELGLGRVRHLDANGNLVPDLPHVQALPGRWDATLRALETPEKRAAFLTRRYAQSIPPL
jgi:hypothetical protein